VTDSANSINSIISTYYQLQATKESEKKAMQQAALAREDQLAQNKIQNAFQQQQLDLSKQGFSWEKMKWGQTWGLTKQQYRDQRNAQLAQAKRQRMLDLTGGVQSQLTAQNQQYNQAIARMGV
jgi:hypothetical protein